jgi:hypothetical protein
MKKLLPFLLLSLFALIVYVSYQNKPPEAAKDYFIPPSAQPTTTEKQITTITPTEATSKIAEPLETFTREEVEHAFGTKPNTVFYPEKAIDTDEAPSIAIKETISDTESLHYYQITPDTYFFFGNIAEVDENNRGWNGNAGFVVTNDSVVVIDALGTPKLGRRIIATIKTVTDKPIKHLIITHNHPDHAYGAIAFKRLGGVTIIGHEGTMKYIESDRIEHSVAYRSTFIKSDMHGFEAVVPDQLIGGALHDKHSIHTGGKTFDIYNTGDHHSFGDLIIHQYNNSPHSSNETSNNAIDNIVWISDLAFNNRVTFMADGHSKQAIDEQNWLLKTFATATYMIPGHGSVQTAPFSMVNKTQSYMQRLRDSVSKAIENDQELQETINTIQFDDWKNVYLYDLNQKKNIDFVYRELEEELF